MNQKHKNYKILRKHKKYETEKLGDDFLDDITRGFDDDPDRLFKSGEGTWKIKKKSTQ